MLGDCGDRRLLTGWEGDEVLQLDLLGIGLVEEDVVTVDNEWVPTHDTVERLAVLQNHLGWTFPISVQIPPEVNPVTDTDSGWVSVDPLLESLPEGGVGLGSSKVLSSHHHRPVVASPLSL